MKNKIKYILFLLLAINLAFLSGCCRCPCQENDNQYDPARMDKAREVNKR